MAALATSSMESENLAIVPVGSACGGTPIPSLTSPTSSMFRAPDAVSATFEEEMGNAVHAMGLSGMPQSSNPAAGLFQVKCALPKCDKMIMRQPSKSGTQSSN